MFTKCPRETYLGNKVFRDYTSVPSVRIFLPHYRFCDPVVVEISDFEFGKQHMTIIIIIINYYCYCK